MADWRYFEPAFWSEEDIQQLSFEEKSFYIYLFTNEHCNQAGVYRITKKTIAFETGLAEKRVEELLRKFIKDRKIELFDGLVWMKNFLKHQPSQNPSVWKRIIKDVQRMQIHSNGLMKRYIEYISTLPITYPQDVNSLIAECSQGVNRNIRKEREREREKETEKEEKNDTPSLPESKEESEALDRIMHHYNTAYPELPKLAGRQIVAWRCRARDWFHVGIFSGVSEDEIHKRIDKCPIPKHFEILPREAIDKAKKATRQGKERAGEIDRLLSKYEEYERIAVDAREGKERARSWRKRKR